MIQVILKFHKILEIIDKSDSDPTLYNPDNITHIIPPIIWIRIIKWVNNHEYIRETIIYYLSDIEFLKFKDIKENISEIWKYLHDEYNRFFNLEYIYTSNDLINLKKNDKIFMNDHINHFE
jgi:hypothetical protein